MIKRAESLHKFPIESKLDSKISITNIVQAPLIVIQDVLSQVRNEYDCGKYY